ncbi:MAG: class I SAM-dependent methyltransferase [Bacteroidaceae bacterium]|nr:class I SAM-dependent methyltransferase [Bacteroidaceae bacterium]MEA5099617.1 class I SAM-dependent methyltransferase [Bacteroidales bacterium]
MIDQFQNKAKDWDNPMQIELTSKFVNQLRNSIFIYEQDIYAEVGCGTGLVGLSFAKDIKKTYMIDNSPSMLNVLKDKLVDSPIADKVEIIENEFEKISLKNLSGIINFLSLHHIEDISSYIKKVKDSLKDNGFFAIGDLVNEDGSFHTNNIVPHFGFDLKNLSNQLEEEGFIILRSTIYDKIYKNDKTYPLFILIAQK